jgi:hypothetical protein
MIIETKEIYKCEHCRKLYQVKRFAEFHEQCCNKNPDNKRACFGCKFLVKRPFELFYDTWSGESSRMLDLFYCNSKEHYLYPPKVEAKGNWLVIENDTDTNEPMPKPNECDKYVDELSDYVGDWISENDLI